MNEEWKLQVSYKIGSSDMINVRANTADELSVLLEGIGDYSTQIAATNKKLAQAYVVLPLSTTSSTPSITPPVSLPPSPVSEASGTAANQMSRSQFVMGWLRLLLKRNKPCVHLSEALVVQVSAENHCHRASKRLSPTRLSSGVAKCRCSQQRQE
jgi:hypothetical protein